MIKSNSPPRLFVKFFRWYCHPKLVKHIEGDLMELYHERLKECGERKADRQFIIDVLLLCRPGIIRPANGYRNLNTYAMYKSYFKIAFRNLLSNKSFSFINISGLAIGLSTCVLIMLYVLDEMNYDKHHQDGNRIYRIASAVNGEKWVAAPGPLAEGLKKDFPEVEQSTRLVRFPGAEKLLLKSEAHDKKFFETNAYYVDSTFFELFTYDLKYGDVQTALNEPNTLVLSESVANRLFGNEDPIDEVLKIGLSFGEFNYTVKGVFRDDKVKSHIPANILLSMNNVDVGGWVKNQTSWASNNIFHSYIKLKEGTNALSFESKLADFLERHGGAEFKAAGFTKTLFLQPVEDIYLHSNYGYEIAPNGNIKYLYIFTSIAAFVLLIACINFMNLSTARSEKRAREVGLRKTVGAHRRSLINQFLCESLLVSGLALAVAIVLIQLTLPYFNQLTEKSLSISEIQHVYVWLLLLTVLTGLCSGIYPSFYLSSFKPIAVLRGKLVNTISAVAIRKGLVVFQFTISIVLIFGALLISRQMNYLSGQYLGFNKNQKIILPIQTNESSANATTLKNELLNNTQVVSAARGGTYPGIESITSMLFYAEGKPATENVDVQTASVEAGYIETLGIKLIRGRSFSKDFADDTQSLVLNESAIKQLGFSIDDAVGHKVYFDLQNKKNEMTIIGVVKDYHFQSLHQKIKPLALTTSPIFNGPQSYLIANIETNDYPALISSFQNLWKKINPNSPFEYSFLDQDFQKNYDKEERTSQLIVYFTVVAILIACLGLFGLTTFTAEQRIKEIGVRKILGASITQIVTLLSKDFLKLVMFSIALSVPIGYYVMNGWLETFAYRVGIEWWVFAVSGLAAILIAIFTISFQAVKAALANPVKSLRAE